MICKVCCWLSSCAGQCPGAACSPAQGTVPPGPPRPTATHAPAPARPGGACIEFLAGIARQRPGGRKVGFPARIQPDLEAAARRPTGSAALGPSLRARQAAGPRLLHLRSDAPGCKVAWATAPPDGFRPAPPGPSSWRRQTLPTIAGCGRRPRAWRPRPAQRRAFDRRQRKVQAQAPRGRCGRTRHSSAIPTRPAPRQGRRNQPAQTKSHALIAHSSKDRPANRG